jgi:hypothetical protein
MSREGITLLGVLCFVFRAWGVDVVYDPILHSTTVADQVVDFAKWAESETHEANTDLQTLNTYEQEVLQVERMGDPKALTANLPGVSNLQTLGQIYTQAQKDITDWSAYVNPESWKLTADNILQNYQQPELIEFTGANGVRIGAAQSLFQFQVSNYNTEAGAQQTVAALNQKLQTLTQQLAQATSAMQAATTQSEVQKYQATISALHASTDATRAALQEAELSEHLQTQQNNNAQEITRSNQAQTIQAADVQAIDAGLNQLPLGNLDTPQLWNSSQ